MQNHKRYQEELKKQLQENKRYAEVNDQLRNLLELLAFFSPIILILLFMIIFAR